MSNQVVQSPKFSTAIQTPSFQRLIHNTLGDKSKANSFITAITSAVANNSELQKCTVASILASAFLGTGLGLSPSPQLGQYYLVPFKSKNKEDIQAQFILGYKGMLQLAIRSNQYKKLNVLEIKEGELISYNPLDEEIEINMNMDFDERENLETIGYYAMFEYTNGCDILPHLR